MSDWILIESESNPMIYAKHLYVLDENNNYSVPTEVVIPEGVSVIESYKFSNINTITKIYLPSTLTRIDYNNFNEFNKIKEVVYNGTIEDWLNIDLSGWDFYLFNNVEQIEKKAIEVANLVPEAKVGYAHGKMSGNEIEEIMQNFIDGKINVLICTTILESGIDMPNANTIIVENADRLGLSQL